MAKRKPLSKSERYEVLKRDSFTCQYCGKSAPEVILEVDHIIPVAEGGSNDMINLITACRDCNRGKGKRMLSDTTVIDKQAEQLKRQNELREQTEMMIQWREELMKLSETQVDAIENLFKNAQENIHFLDGGRATVRDLIRRFGFSEVYEATEIAIDTYYFKYGKPAVEAFDKIGGICWNRKHKKEWGNE